MSHACARNTQSRGWSMPAAGRPGGEQKANHTFSGVPAVSPTDKHFSGEKGIRAEHGLQNEQWLLKYPSV